MKTSFLMAVSMVLLLAGCRTESEDASETPARTTAFETYPLPDTFGDYWYQGQAELTSYTLEQARYGEVHPGEAVLIFVTEDFSRSKQVKLDNPATAGDDAVKVLKLNTTRNFNTGIYPYSIMTSVFTPVYPEQARHTLKVTTSVQEWCGHAFSQLNRTEAGYRVRQFSYFESEGDRTLDLEAAFLEDEVWNTIRLRPDALPVGSVRMVPGTLFQRLRHTAWTVQDVRAELTEAEGRKTYTLRYPELGRTLTIRFNVAFPYEIEGWEETYRSGFGPDAGPLTTRATRNKRLLLDYWTHNSLDDASLRHELGLE